MREGVPEKGDLRYPTLGERFFVGVFLAFGGSSAQHVADEREKLSPGTPEQEHSFWWQVSLRHIVNRKGESKSPFRRSRSGAASRAATRAS